MLSCWRKVSTIPVQKGYSVRRHWVYDLQATHKRRGNLCQAIHAHSHSGRLRGLVDGALSSMYLRSLMAACPLLKGADIVMWAVLQADCSILAASTSGCLRVMNVQCELGKRI